MADDYKTSKVEFVSNQSGTSVAHVNLLSSITLSSIALYSALRSRLPPTKSLNLITEYVLLVLPPLLSLTLFANKPLVLSAILLLPTGLLLLVPAQSFHSLPSSRPSSRPPSPISYQRSHTQGMADYVIAVQPIPALTTYRTHMLLMTFIAILAVDFSVFPRNLAKCETFGVSVMDMGVGSFVFSQGLISAMPVLKNPSHLSAPLLPKLTQVTKKMLPLICLGLTRVLLVKGTEYPEHESEYGTHWNFFLTLAALPPLQVILHLVFLEYSMLSVGLVITLFHQLILSNTSLQSWTLFAARTNFFAQNKEGLVSLPGYLAIHVLGLLTGTILLPQSPSDFRRIQKSIRRNRADTSVSLFMKDMKPRQRQDAKTAIELCSYAAVWWSLLGLGSLIGLGGGVSRRLANSRYVFWVVAYNTSFITAYLVLDLLFFPQIREHKAPKNILSPVGGPSAVAPSEMDMPRKAAPLLEAINLNGLPLFLLANIFTGLINMTVKTMYTSDFKAMAILLMYTFGISIVAWVLRGRRVWKI